MKIIAFSTASAILSIFGLSAYRTAKATYTTYYWVLVVQNVPIASSNLPKSTVVLLATAYGGAYSGSSSTLLFATATTVFNLEIFNNCVGAGDYCLAGFSSSNPASIVTSTHFAHLAATIVTPFKLGQQQTP